MYLVIGKYQPVFLVALYFNKEKNTQIKGCTYMLTVISLSFNFKRTQCDDKYKQRICKLCGWQGYSLGWKIF